MWQIKGMMALERFSGQYTEEELKSLLILALEISPDEFYFDNYLEGRDLKGNTLSGSQLLAIV